MQSHIYASKPMNEDYFQGKPMKIGNQKQLFVDDTMVENRLNLRRVQQQATKRVGSPILVADKPWEKGAVFMPTVIYDETESLYKMWYWSFDREAFYLGMDLEKGSCMYKMLYAESGDGIAWTKPNLQSVAFGPYAESNIVFTGNGGCGAGRVFIDHTDPDPNGRFKVFYNEKGKGAGLSLASSPDGRCWKIVRHCSGVLKGDCHLHVLFDETRQTWQVIGRPRVLSEIYPRNLSGIERLNAPKYHSMRRIAMAESKDLQNFSKARELLRPSEFHNFTEMDNMTSFAYGGKLLAFVGCFTDDPHRQTMQRMEDYFAFCSDGYTWQTLPNPKPILPRGGKGDFDEALAGVSGYPMDFYGNIGFYYTGYAESADSMIMQTAIGMAMFRKDGFVELSAGAEGGCLVTKEFILEGNQIELNCRSAGPKTFTLVEIVEFDGRSPGVVEGFSWEDCDPITANVDKFIVSWNGQSNLEALRGKSVYLRIYMQNAGIYSLTVGKGE